MSLALPANVVSIVALAGASTKHGTPVTEAREVQNVDTRVGAANIRGQRLYLRARARLQSCRELEKMTTTTIDVSEALERVDNIVNTLDEICDHMDGFSSAEEAWLSSITETLRTWRYVMQETYESAEDKRGD